MKTAGARPAFATIAARLAARFPREQLDPAVLAWVASSSRRKTPWGVAFSGGADSLALLLLIWAHWPERRRTVRVLHFDHRLRGAASKADARFCERVCRVLKLRCVSAAWTGAHADASEAEARAARLAFLARHARVLWLGHQQDDIAETMLMRLARGSGTGGLAAPRPVQPMPAGRVHLRPLLSLKKQAIVQALREAGAVWREDSSNAGDRFFRNRIRSAVVPAWAEAAQRDALAGAARSRRLLEEDDAALDAWVDALKPVDRRGALQIAALTGKPRALWRRALHKWLLEQTRAGRVSSVAFDALLGALEAGKSTRQSLGQGGFAVMDGKVLRFNRQERKEGNSKGPSIDFYSRNIHISR